MRGGGGGGDSSNKTGGHHHAAKNLMAERLRREKLSGRLLELRSLVPIITNMNKATIITDAITYIKELQLRAGDLSNQLLVAAAVDDDDAATDKEAEDDHDHDHDHDVEIIAADDHNKVRRWDEVTVAELDGKKVWVKTLVQKKKTEGGGGGSSLFYKLMEAIANQGFHFSDITMTTCRGSMLLTCSLIGHQDLGGHTIDIPRITESLQAIIHNINHS